MSPSPAGPVLITGCSTGIGRSTAERLLKRGATVWASARRRESLRKLEDLGAHVAVLDVTDADNCESVVQRIIDTHGPIGALVNNAGYSESGPIELVGDEAARNQFETNVFAPMRLARLVLPSMREVGRGRIVNVSSMGGRFTFPAGGWYHASKYALESLSDALRFEVAPFGIQVVLVEPGPVATEFGGTALASESIAIDGENPYADLIHALNLAYGSAYKSTKIGGPISADRVARVIDKAITKKQPRTRYPVGAMARGLITTRRLLPDRAWDAFVGRTFRLP